MRARRHLPGLLFVLLGAALLTAGQTTRFDLGRTQKITLRIAGALLVLAGGGLVLTSAPGRH